MEERFRRGGVSVLGRRVGQDFGLVSQGELRREGNGGSDYIDFRTTETEVLPTV